MAQLDPQFATPPTVMQITNAVCDAVFPTQHDSLGVPAFKRQQNWICREILTLEDDVDDLQKKIADLKVQIPELEHELLVAERDIAEKRLVIFTKQAKLAELNGGQQ